MQQAPGRVVHAWQVCARVVLLLCVNSPLHHLGRLEDSPPPTHPSPPWMTSAAALVPLAVSLLLTSCLLLSKLLPGAAATAGAWVPPGWGKTGCRRTPFPLTCHCTPAPPPPCSCRCSPGAPPRPPPAFPSWPRPPCGRWWAAWWWSSCQWRRQRRRPPGCICPGTSSHSPGGALGSQVGSLQPRRPYQGKRSEPLY